MTEEEFWENPSVQRTLDGYRTAAMIQGWQLAVASEKVKEFHCRKRPMPDQVSDD